MKNGWSLRYKKSKSFGTLVPRKQRPKIRFNEKHAITVLDPQTIAAAEHNPERRAFYRLCWHLGGAQFDAAHP